MQSLLTRFTAYLRSMDSVEEIDTLPEFKSLTGQPIADYFCKKRQIIIEQKCVTADQSAKIQKLIEGKLDPEYLNFYGTRKLQEILAEAPNGDEINRGIYQVATRLLEGYLKQAKSQIQSTRELANCPSASGMLLILNDRIWELSPEIISRRLLEKMSEKRLDGTWRFHGINFALLISETHLHRGLYHRCILIEGPDADFHRVSKRYIDRLVKGWSQLCGGDLIIVPGDEHSFNLDQRKSIK